MYGEEQEILGYKVVQSCGGCPEAYEVVDAQDTPIGYLRLRHGFFYAEYTVGGAERVYEGSPKGDGVFYDDEREYYLTEAVKALDERHARVVLY
jgi:hypothetical protein